MFEIVLTLEYFSQDSPSHYTEQNNAAMELIDSVTGIDEEGRSRQRILTYAARRYIQLLLFEMKDSDTCFILCMCKGFLK